MTLTIKRQSVLVPSRKRRNDKNQKYYIASRYEDNKLVAFSLMDNPKGK